LHLKTRGSPMSEPSNDYIRRVKSLSTFLWRLRYPHHIASPLDRLAPLPPDEDPPK